jgi:hypothetical protein
MQEYEAKLATLKDLRRLLIPSATDEDVRTFDEALSAWVKNNESAARYQEKRFRTRYFCAVCYGEIPQMQEVSGRGLQAHAHRVCEHLYSYDMAGLRKQIQSGHFEHDPNKDALTHRPNGCPVLTDGWPTMHPKRSTFEEPR